MVEKEFRRIIKWLIIIVAGVVMLSLLTRRDFQGSSGPVWKSLTIHEKPSSRH